MQTVRLFYQDPFMKTCAAKVEECRKADKYYEVRLDRTVFYPEGGGQPADRGTLNGIEVIDVQEKDGEIWHTTKEPLEEGVLAEGVIDWERRFDLMQQHAGEHIVSGLIHARFGYNNVGFHMGSDTITVDLDGEVSEAELREIEEAANRYVMENREIVILHPTEEELKTLSFRSKKELTGDVRIVVWPGVDICACCGIHVERSGQIGQIVLVSSQRFKGGVRIEMLCGRRALAYMNQLKEQNRRISNLLSAKWTNVADAVERLQNEYQQMKFRMVGMELQKVSDMAEKMKNAGNQLVFEDGMSPEAARKLAAEGMECCGGICAVFNGNDQEGYRYIIGEKNGDLRELVRSMNQSLNGRGGGKPFFVQGSVQSSRKEIEAFFKERA